MHIGFDLDKVFINYPPFIPGKIIDWLYKRGLRDFWPLRSPTSKELHYRYPKSKLERWVRKLSHFWLLRPKIKRNIEFINNFPHNPHPHTLYLISSRYKFLEDITRKLLKRYGINGHFKSVHLNLTDDQPHHFKERVIKDLKLDIFIDDDLALLEYLKSAVPSTTLLWYSPSSKSDEVRGIKVLKDFNQIKSYLPH